MTPRKPKPARELAARALCRKAGLPEDSIFQGRPMWEDFLPDADAVLEAIGRGEGMGAIMKQNLPIRNLSNAGC